MDDSLKEYWEGNYLRAESEVALALFGALSNYIYLLEEKYSDQLSDPLGPRGARHEQYRVFQHLYSALLQHIALEPRRDPYRYRYQDGLRTISTLMKAAFLSAFGERYSRQKLQRWTCVLKTLWLKDVDFSEASNVIHKMGGVQRIADGWAAEKRKFFSDLHISRR